MSRNVLKDRLLATCYSAVLSGEKALLECCIRVWVELSPSLIECEFVTSLCRALAVGGRREIAHHDLAIYSVFTSATRS